MNANGTAAVPGVIPLISTSSAGPLGIVHLPRFWLKLRLVGLGLLPPGYGVLGGGTDSALLAAFELDGPALAADVAAGEPDYRTFENAIRERARDLSSRNVNAYNAQALGHQLPEPRRTEWTKRFGLRAGTYTRALDLNQLDDWDGVRAQIVAPDAPSTPLVPAISSSVPGPLGVLHLPRLWLKQLLHAAGRLPEGYFHGRGFDEVLAGALGFDGAAFGAFVAAERPGYLEAETWVRRHATTLTPDAIATVNERFRSASMPEPLASELRARFAISEGSYNLGWRLNDLDDWGSLHDGLLAEARARHGEPTTR
jgi:hypothetical protein